VLVLPRDMTEIRPGISDRVPRPVLLDATVIRMAIGPALLRLAGRWNWWSPAPLAALHRRIGLSEG